jgi:hypothetical protein
MTIGDGIATAAGVICGTVILLYVMQRLSRW